MSEIENRNAGQTLPAPICSTCEFHKQMGITLLDAKWLDPECHTGCQSLVLKHHIERLESALVAARKQLLERNGLDRDGDRKAAIAINVALSSNVKGQRAGGREKSTEE